MTISRFGLTTSVAAAALCFGAGVGAYQGGSVKGGGAIAGSVSFSGKAASPTMQRVTRDFRVCGKQKRSQELEVGGGGALKNVVVFIEGIKKGKPAKKRTAVVDQKACMYVPHVQAALRGSRLEIRNSDSVLHTVHGKLWGKTDVFNVAMPTKGQKIKKRLKKSGAIKLNCDVGHTWMQGYVYVVDHPYFAVTKADGRFSIGDVPPGKYKLTAWHEKLGKKTVWINVKAKKTATAKLRF